MDGVHPVKFGNQQQSDQLRHFLIESLLFGAIHFLGVFSKKIVERCEVFVDWSDAQNYKRIDLSQIKIHFNQQRNGLRFKQYLYGIVKILNADQVAFQQALLYCENDKLKLVKETTRDLQKSIKSELLYNSSNGYPTLPLIAQRLNMSERTIKRHLQAQGTTSLQILAEVDVLVKPGSYCNNHNILFRTLQVWWVMKKPPILFALLKRCLAKHRVSIGKAICPKPLHPTSPTESF